MHTEAVPVSAFETGVSVYAAKNLLAFCLQGRGQPRQMYGFVSVSKTEDLYIKVKSRISDMSYFILKDWMARWPNSCLDSAWLKALHSDLYANSYFLLQLPN